MKNRKEKKLVLLDGSEYYGYGFGSDSEKICELVFNTSPVGYQEIISDLSYTDQFVVMAYPLIGNYGINDDDFEADSLSIGGLVVKDYNDLPSNFRAKYSLSQCMEKWNIVGISDLDTRALIRKIRDEGSQKALITDANVPKEEAIQRLQAYELPTDQVKRVSLKEKKEYKCQQAKYKIAVLDFGIKKNIIRYFLENKCDLTIFPYNTSASEIENFKPDGVFLSNGPGDPTDVGEAIDLVKEIKGKYPIFGICLGHQIISLAYGAKTYKLKFGHRGGNHPVKNLKTGKIEITSQNHSFAVDEKSLLSTRLEATHINLLDKTIEGTSCKEDRVFSVQYHPEAAPGPVDSEYLFGQFIEWMEERKCQNEKI